MKVCCGHLTAGILSQSFSESDKSFNANDKAYYFILLNVLQPIGSIFFLKFLQWSSCLVFQLSLWHYVVLIYIGMDWFQSLPSWTEENLLQEDINNMDFFQRCIYLNMNSVLMARHFQHSVEIFFKVTVVDGSLGKVKHHIIRVELQVRGSPHFHSFLWILNAPVLFKTNIDVYINFVDLATYARKTKVPGSSLAASYVQRWDLCNIAWLISKCLCSGWKK